MQKEKGQIAKYNRLKRIWDRLNDSFKEDLKVFLKCDDYGKK